ncbi:MAG: hypothetical protein K0S29_252 [Gammaproteobacteria bacterium]|nr:hypothetical protein [Gammaproteobacteria bacterium]
MKTVHEYIERFSKAKGNNLAKVKHILTQYSERWDWIGSGSIIADLLDDKNIAAEDILEVLHNAVEMEEGNREFKSAVTAIKIALKKTYRHCAAEAIDMDEFKDYGSHDYQSGDFYSGSFAEAS